MATGGHEFPTPRTFLDRGIRRLLGHPRNFKSLIVLADPELARQLAFEQVTSLNTAMIAPRLDEMIPDSVLMAPWTAMNIHETIGVTFIVEHESAPKPEISMRFLSLLTRVLENQIRNGATERRQRSLVAGVLLYTGRQAMSRPPRLREIMACPAEFAKLLPDFDILYVSLHEVPMAVLQSAGAFGCLLCVLRSLADDFESLASSLHTLLCELASPGRGSYWSDMVRFSVQMMQRIRTPEELEELLDMVKRFATEIQLDDEWVPNIRTAADALREEGEAKGRGEGREEGREVGREEGRAAGLAEGQLHGIRQSILQIGQRRWGLPSAEFRRQLEGVQAQEQLADVLEQLLTAADWSALDLSARNRHSA